MYDVRVEQKKNFFFFKNEQHTMDLRIYERIHKYTPNKEYPKITIRFWNKQQQQQHKTPTTRRE